MRIIHITNNNYDGVGRAVIRLHEELLKQGAKSKVLVLYKKHKTDDVICFAKEKEIIYRKFKNFIIMKLIYILTKYNFYIIKKKIIHKIFNIMMLKKGPYLFNYLINYIKYFEISRFIHKDDIVILYSVQNFINPEYIQSLSELCQNKLIIRPMDMEPITGGCHFNYGCDNYVRQCDNCPQLIFPFNKFIPKNILLRKKAEFSKSNYQLIVSNNYVKSITDHSYLFNSKNTKVIYMGIEPEKYSNITMQKSRKIFDINIEDKVIVYGCFNLDDKRKGAYLLKKSLKKLLIDVDSKTYNLLHLITFGNLGSMTFNDIDIKWTHLGLIDTPKEMNYIYRSSDLLASPSVDELGPTILQEAFLNDLPIVAFDMGLSRDLIIESVNGYIIPCFDTEKFSDAIRLVLAGKMSGTANQKQEIINRQKMCTSEYEAISFKNMANKFVSEKKLK
jgi:glycosyltransferase involved in cell wall biosynthesis